MDIRIILFSIVFLFALWTNKEGFMVRPTEGNISTLEDQMPTHLLYESGNEINNYNENNYNTDGLYDMNDEISENIEIYKYKLDTLEEMICEENRCSPSPSPEPESEPGSDSGPDPGSESGPGYATYI